MGFNKVLITLDGSAFAERAIPAALKVIKPGAQIHLLSIIESATQTPMPFVSAANGYFATEMVAAERAVYPEELRLRREYLAGLRAQLTDKGYEVTTEATGGEVVHAITNVAVGYDLLMMATHGRTGLGRFIFGSVTEAVLHHLPCPILIVPSTTVVPEMNNDCILVCLDGTQESEAILPQVEKVLTVHPAKVILMKVEPYAQFSALKFSTDEYLTLSVNTEIEARQYLEQVGERLRKSGATPVIEVNFNQPEQEIGVLTKYHQVDLIAMATHGRTGIDRFLKGSVTEDVLHQLHHPMLIVRMPQPAVTL